MEKHFHFRYLDDLVIPLDYHKLNTLNDQSLNGMMEIFFTSLFEGKQYSLEPTPIMPVHNNMHVHELAVHIGASVV